MADGNYNNCAYGEGMISYLYGEIDAREKSVFEEHLRICSTCADEIAGFGSVRSSILQWKTEEFQSLNTPKIVFQNAPTESADNISIFPVKINSWVDRFRKIFVPSPVWAAGFVFFIILGGLLLFVNNFSNNNQIVKVGTEDSQTANSPSINPGKKTEIAEKTISDESQPVSEEKLPESGQPSNKNLIAKGSESNKSNKSNKTNIRVAPAAGSEQVTLSKTYAEVSKKNIPAAARKFGNSNTAVAAKVPARKLQIPKLNPVEDGEEEATLRLTDLFDEVGDK